MEKKKSLSDFEFKLNKIYKITNEKQWDTNSEYKCKIYLNDEKIDTVVYLNDNQDHLNRLPKDNRKIYIKNIDLDSRYELRIDCKSLGILSRYSMVN